MSIASILPVIVIHVRTCYASGCRLHPDFLRDGLEAADGEGAVGVLLPVGFHAVAEGDVVGGDEEGCHEVALFVGGGVGDSFQEGLHLFCALPQEGGVVEQIGADEHQGREPGGIGGVGELHAGIAVEELKLLPVGLAELGGAALAVAVAEQFDELALEIGEGVLVEERPCAPVGQHDVVDAESGHEHFHAVEEAEEDGECDAPAAVDDVGDDAGGALHRSADDVDPVAACHLGGGAPAFADGEVELRDAGAEELHAPVGYGDEPAVAVVHGPEGQCEVACPRLCEDVGHEVFRAADEDVAAQVAAQGVAVGGGVVAFGLFAAVAAHGGAVVYVAVGDEIVERGQWLLAVGV